MECLVIRDFSGVAKGDFRDPDCTEKQLIVRQGTLQIAGRESGG